MTARALQGRLTRWEKRGWDGQRQSYMAAEEVCARRPGVTPSRARGSQEMQAIWAEISDKRILARRPRATGRANPRAPCRMRRPEAQGRRDAEP